MSSEQQIGAVPPCPDDTWGFAGTCRHILQAENDAQNVAEQLTAPQIKEKVEELWKRTFTTLNEYTDDTDSTRFVDAFLRSPFGRHLADQLSGIIQIQATADTPEKFEQQLRDIMCEEQWEQAYSDIKDSCRSSKYVDERKEIINQGGKQ